MDKSENVLSPSKHQDDLKEFQDGFRFCLKRNQDSTAAQILPTLQALGKGKVSHGIKMMEQLPKELGKKQKVVRRWEPTKTAQGWLPAACWVEGESPVTVERRIDIFEGEGSFCPFQEMLSVALGLLPEEWMRNCTAHSTTARSNCCSM